MYWRLYCFVSGASAPKHAAVHETCLVLSPVVWVCSWPWLIARTGVVFCVLFYFVLSDKSIKANRGLRANRNFDCRANPDCCDNIGGYWAPLPCSLNKLDNEDGAVRMSYRRWARHGTAGGAEVPVPRCDTCFWVAATCWQVLGGTGSCLYMLPYKVAGAYCNIALSAVCMCGTKWLLVS
jgi:hypothetical protein